MRARAGVALTSLALMAACVSPPEWRGDLNAALGAGREVVVFF